MATETRSDSIPPLRPGRLNVYSPADIKRWGVERFLDVVAQKEPLPMPDLGFTAEENALMDEILRQERDEAARGL